MNVPLIVHCPDVTDPESFRERVREQVVELEGHVPGLESCRVTVERTHRRHHDGSGWCAKIEGHLAGHRVAVSRDHAAADPHQALEEAMLALRRQLEKHVQVRRGEVKHHEAPEPPTSDDEGLE